MRDYCGYGGMRVRTKSEEGDQDTKQGGHDGFFFVLLPRHAIRGGAGKIVRSGE